MLAADELELAWRNDPALSPEAQAALKAKAEAYRKTVARYDSEPETARGQEGTDRSAPRNTKRKRDHALKQDPYFDYAEALLQIAIVLISVAIIADLVWLSFFGGALGLDRRAADDQRLSSCWWNFRSWAERRG